MDDNRLSQNEMIGVPIDEFVTGNTIPVDVYVRLSETKFVKVANAGSQTRRESLSSYQNKKVDLLWVRKDDYSKLAQLHVKIAGIIASKSDMSADQKTTAVSTAAKAVFEEISTMGIPIQSYESARQMTDAVVKLVEHQKDLAAMVTSLNSFSNELVRHSMAVSAFSVMIGQAMGFKKSDILQKLALGGLLHDIGKKAINPELVKKSKSEMTHEELKEYETHPFKGMQMLTQLTMIPREVVAMVFEHHENSLAQGFPQRLRDYRINPFARIVALANEFANLTISNPTHQVPRSFQDAVDYIEHTMGQPYNRDVFRALKLHFLPHEKEKKFAA